MEIDEELIALSKRIKDTSAALNKTINVFECRLHDLRLSVEAIVHLSDSGCGLGFFKNKEVTPASRGLWVIQDAHRPTRLAQCSRAVRLEAIGAFPALQRELKRKSQEFLERLERGLECVEDNQTREKP